MKIFFKKAIALVSALAMVVGTVTPSIVSNAATTTKSLASKRPITDSKGKHFTSEFIMNDGTRVFCAENYEADPEIDDLYSFREMTGNETAYTKDGGTTTSNFEMIRKALYYGIGGPAAELGDSNEDWYKMVSALSYAYCGYAHNGTTWLSWYYTLSSKLAPPSNYKVYIGTKNGDTSDSWQRLMYGVMEIPPTGSLIIRKSSALPSITDGNNCYSLEGAVYGVYREGGDYVTPDYKITTDANGYGRLDNIPAGNYWVKEIRAPKGYELNESWLPSYETPIYIGSGAVETIYTTDVPGNDPVGIEIVKTKGGEAYVGHTPSLAGTQFTVTHFGRYFDSVDEIPKDADGKVQADRTKGDKQWVIEVKESIVSGEKRYFTSLTEFYKVSGDDFTYLPGNPQPTFGLGTLTIQETRPADGYSTDNCLLQEKDGNGEKHEIFMTKITEDSSGDVSLVGGKEFLSENYVLYGGIAVQKYDSEGNTAQGAAKLNGAQFTVKNATGYTITTSDGKTYDDGELITTLTTDANGYAVTANDFLPYGEYEVEEIKAPEGYKLEGTNLKQIVKVEKEKVLAVASSTYDNVIRGGLTIQKMDNDTGSVFVQGEATLEGAQVAIKNANENSVYVNGKSYAKGETVLTLTTDENGRASTGSNVLPYGTYGVVEVKSPEGYKLSGENLSQTIVIKEENVVVSMKPIYDDIIRGGIEIHKYDSQTNSNHAQGSATLEGAEFTVKSLNDNRIIINKVSYKNGDVITTITTDENGIAKTELNLPYGLYEVEETKAPEGYKLSGEHLKQTVFVDTDGTYKVLNTENTVVKDDIIRGDFKLHKIEHYSGRVMADVEFKITSKTTGESHVIKTDANGDFASKDSDLWFGLNADGSSVAKKDGVGKLPYDAYTIEELRCDANIMTDLYTGEFTIDKDGEVVDIGIIENYERSIDTNAKDSETGENYSTPDEDVTIIDEVSYQGLFVGEEYTVKGILMDKLTGEPILDKDGNEIVAESTFVPEEREGKVDVEFKFDGSELEGSVAVVFETLYDVDGVIQAEHKDINDEDQTIYFPEISTSLVDENGYKVVFAGPTKLVDTVTYVGLEIGKEYTVVGTLMDQKTEKPALDVDGKEITASTTFTAEEKDGTVDVVFEFDAKVLAGKTLVAFEKLILDEKEYAVHEDIKDDAQTVYIPKIGTSAYDKADGDKSFISKGTVTVVDKVSYENLTVGERYVAKGVLMDKTTGKALLIDGKEVTATKEFTVTTVNGFVELEFTFDASELGTRDLVVFEELYQIVKVVPEIPETPEVPDTPEQVPGEGEEISPDETLKEAEPVYEERLVAEHKDINDKDQTVSFATQPKTGVVTYAFGYLGMALVSVIALFVVFKKRIVK